METKNVQELKNGESFVLVETNEFCHIIGGNAVVKTSFEGPIVARFIGLLKMEGGTERAIFWLDGKDGGYVMFGTDDMSYIKE